MEQLRKIFETSGTLHHAYLVVAEDSAPLFLFLEETVGVQRTGNPDFWHGRFDAFSIEDARKLATSQEAKDFNSGRKIFVVEANSISEAAQNSLLKVFEEPTKGTHFFIVMPQDTLVPTLRSRMQVIHSIRDLPNDSTPILSLDFAERMKLVKQITEAISDDDKTKQDAIALVNRIETELYVAGLEKNAQLLSVCEEARLSLYDNGAPIKMVLEHVMLAV